MGFASQRLFLDTTTDAIARQKPLILERLQQRAERSNDPALDRIRAAKPEDLQIALHEQQGASKLTYRVELADRTYILSVFIPNPERKENRASTENRRDFRRHLRAHGVPIPGRIGVPFDLPGLPHKCELTEFCHGYQLAKNARLTDTQIASIGEMMGRMHASHFTPQGHHTSAQRRIAMAARGLPHGYVHGDLSRGNLIFDPETHHIAGVIDFEWARDKCYIDEIARVLRFYATDIVPGPQGVEVTLNPEKSERLMAAYEQHRPLTPKEKTALPKQLEREIAREERIQNRTTHVATLTDELLQHRPTPDRQPIGLQTARLAQRSDMQTPCR